ncbi:MAG: hypothetical protein KDI75_08130 [Xanthomonadales bacterium]|nr:hypothetical protein [Xanthomonadales bacterium]
MKTMLRSGLFVVGFLAISAAAIAGGGERFAAEGTIGDKWMAGDGASFEAAGYPAHYLSTAANVCMAIAYRIGEDGSTSDFLVLDQWNSVSEDKEPVVGFWQAFASAGAGALSNWRFKPRPEVTDPVPTVTVATLTFGAQANVDVHELRSHCRVENLAASIEHARSEVATRSARREDGILRQGQENRYRREQRDTANAINRAVNGG